MKIQNQNNSFIPRTEMNNRINLSGLSNKNESFNTMPNYSSLGNFSPINQNIPNLKNNNEYYPIEENEIKMIRNNIRRLMPSNSPYKDNNVLNINLNNSNNLIDNQNNDNLNNQNFLSSPNERKLRTIQNSIKQMEDKSFEMMQKNEELKNEQKTNFNPISKSLNLNSTNLPQEYATLKSDNILYKDDINRLSKDNKVLLDQLNEENNGSCMLK